MTITELSQLSDSYLCQLVDLESQLFGTDGWHKQALQTLFVQDYHRFFVVEYDNTIIGYCLLQAIFDTAEILRIGVAKTFQGQGFAKYLLAKLIEELGQQRGNEKTSNAKVEKILLEVREDNLAAIYLYQSFGFEQIHIRKHYYDNADGTKSDALILQKLL